MLFQRLLLKDFFSVYGNVLEGRESLTVANAVMLTRVALHGPPPATEESATLAKEAMDNGHWTIIHRHMKRDIVPCNGERE